MHLYSSLFLVFFCIACEKLEGVYFWPYHMFLSPELAVDVPSEIEVKMVTARHLFPVCDGQCPLASLVSGRVTGWCGHTSFNSN